jgi:zinc transporter
MSGRRTIELPDERGLICGFILRPQEAPIPLDWEAAVQALSKADTSLWLHFNLSDTRARSWIANCDRIPQAARDLLLEANPRIQLETTESGFVSVLGDLQYNFDTDPDGVGLVRLYMDASLLITVRRQPLKSTDRLRQDLSQGLPIDAPIQLLVQLLQYLTELFDTVVADRGEVVDDIEELILKERFQDQRSELGRVRRLLARLQRQMRANRHALIHLIARLPSWCSGYESLLRQNLDRWDGVIQDLELVQERARLLQEEIAGQLNETVNRNLYMLSIVTTVFLPITLITGVFGMNVGGLPWVEDNLGFWWVVVVMGLTLATTLSMLQRQRFF